MPEEVLYNEQQGIIGTIIDERMASVELPQSRLRILPEFNESLIEETFYVKYFGYEIEGGFNRDFGEFLAAALGRYYHLACNSTSLIDDTADCLALRVMQSSNFAV